LIPEPQEPLKRTLGNFISQKRTRKLIHEWPRFRFIFGCITQCDVVIGAAGNKHRVEYAFIRRLDNTNYTPTTHTLSVTLTQINNPFVDHPKSPLHIHTRNASFNLASLPKLIPFYSKMKYEPSPSEPRVGEMPRKTDDMFKVDVDSRI